MIKVQSGTFHKDFNKQDEDLSLINFQNSLNLKEVAANWSKFKFINSKDIHPPRIVFVKVNQDQG